MMSFVLSISEIQERVSDLVLKLANRSQYVEDATESDYINQFSTNLIKQAYVARQREGIEDELVESLINLLALAGMLGVDLEQKIYETLILLETVNSYVG